MNEPSNFCDGECLPSDSPIATTKAAAGASNSEPIFDPVNPPYAINNRGCRSPLDEKTVSMDAIQYNTIAYNAHNMYGYAEAKTTSKILKEITHKRYLNSE